MAREGRRRVEDMLEAGFSIADTVDDDHDDDGGRRNDATTSDVRNDDVRRVLQHVRPPPLFVGDDVASSDVPRSSHPSSSHLRPTTDDDDSHRGGGGNGGGGILTPKHGEHKRAVSFASSSSVALPTASSIEMSPGFNSVTIIPPTPKSPVVVVVDDVHPSSSTTRPTPSISPSKLNGLVGLLSRCPSPSRYANAALLGRDEDYNNDGEGEGEGYRDVRKAAGVVVGGDDDERSSSDAPWNVDYLEYYSIEYREDEEFDNIGGGGGGGGGRRGHARMLPMDRIRPTLGQNLAKLDLCGCKCSLFDLSGAVSHSVDSVFNDEKYNRPPRESLSIGRVHPSCHSRR
jgi:hypothetical protein